MLGSDKVDRERDLKLDGIQIFSIYSYIIFHDFLNCCNMFSTSAFIQRLRSLLKVSEADPRRFER